MAAAALRQEEAFGLVLAAAAHAGLVAWLVLRPPVPEPLPLPETISVTLSDDVGLTSTSPEPTAQPSPDSAPSLGEAPPPPEPVVRVEPEPVRKVVPKPVPKATLKPATTPQPQPNRRTTPNPRPTPRATPSAAPGSNRFNQVFGSGVPNAPATGTSPYLPASQIGANVKSSLLGAISREIKPRWAAPQGAEVEKLETYVTWNLKPDGTLDGTPRVTRQLGITDANRAQAARHAEQALRAIRLAAPFELPEQYYNAWKRVVDFRFDRRLSQ